MAAARDPFLDGLRAVSVVRVIALHLLQHAEHPFVATFSFFMPGMPLMFFVSGALAAVSLGAGEPGRRARFWRERARRLLVPFWAFGASVLALCAVGAIAAGGPQHAFPWDTLWRWVLPLAGPQASPAFDRLDWHLWFLSVLVVMLATAPWSLALHRRHPGAGALAFLTAGAAVEIAGVDVPGVVRNTLLFGAAFQLGYLYADGRIARVRGATLLALAGGLAFFALWFHAETWPNEMLHAVPLALVALGLAFVALWLRLRASAVRVFARPLCGRWIRALNARAYTIFLWGPIGSDLARRIVTPSGPWDYLLEFALAIAFLVVFVRVFGPVEDWAARRGRVVAAAAAAPAKSLERAAA